MPTNGKPRHTRLHAQLVKACAEHHGVSPRAVRTWRAENDPRWAAWCAQKALDFPVPARPEPDEAPEPVPGQLGLENEIRRLRQECHDLAVRARAAQRDGRLDQELTLHKALDAKRESLRHLERDTPAVSALAGDYVPKDSVLHYVADIRSRIEALPVRVGTLLPDDLATDIRAQIEAECNSILAACAEVEFGASSAR